jgi:hypothetical protein
MSPNVTILVLQPPRPFDAKQSDPGAFTGMSLPSNRAHLRKHLEQPTRDRTQSGMAISDCLSRQQSRAPAAGGCDELALGFDSAEATKRVWFVADYDV